MTHMRARFHQRLLGRAIIFVVLPTVLVLAAMIVLAMRSGFGNLRAAAERELTTEGKLAAAEMESRNGQAAISAQRMAEAQMAGLFGERAASIELARRVLADSTSVQLTGASFGYEPNADGLDRESLGAIPAEAMDANGRFIPYWFVSTESGTLELEPLVDMETSQYYQGTKDAFARAGRPVPLVTEPYVYRGKMMVEHTYPIVIDGRFRGVACVDRALRDVERYLLGVSERLGYDVFLVSSGGKFIAATTDAERSRSGALETKPVSETPYAALFARLLVDRGDRVLLREVDPVNGATCYFAASKVPTGDWTIILRRSDRDVIAPIYRQLGSNMLLAGGGVALVATILVASIARVSRRLNLAADGADRIARGDLSQHIDPGESRDETGTLLRSLRAMTDNLNRFVGAVKQASIQINSTANEVTATSRQQEEVAASFGSSTSQIAAALKEISATSAELVQTMGEVSRVASETAQRATTGRAGLQEMERSMRGLDEATRSIAEKLAAINERTSSITGVVTTIAKVAEQTNLLSVNAAIEAEKAGEYGVGFLVVAREIRRLADQSAAATSDIEQMVHQMQSAVSAGVMEMDRFADQVRRSVGEVEGVSHQLARIIEQVDANTASFARVSEGMLSQSQGAEQISEAMTQLTDGAAQTMEAVREYGHAAEDLQGAMSSLKASIEAFQLGSARS